MRIKIRRQILALTCGGSYSEASDCLIVLRVGVTHRPLSSSFLGLPYRILNINHKKELLLYSK